MFLSRTHVATTTAAPTTAPAPTTGVSGECFVVFQGLQKLLIDMTVSLLVRAYFKRTNQGNIFVSTET